MKTARQSLAVGHAKVHVELAGRYFAAVGSGCGCSDRVFR
jgi:hypothetical protein